MLYGKQLLTPDEWFESVNMSASTRNAIVAKTLRRLTDKNERRYARKYLSNCINTWLVRRPEKQVKKLSYFRQFCNSLIKLFQRHFESSTAIDTNNIRINNINNLHASKFTLSQALRRISTRLNDDSSIVILSGDNNFTNTGNSLSIDYDWMHLRDKLQLNPINMLNVNVNSTKVNICSTIKWCIID